MTDGAKNALILLGICFVWGAIAYAAGYAVGTVRQIDLTAAFIGHLNQ